MKYYGWFSNQQKKIAGYASYLTPEGQKVEVSSITNSTHWNETSFKDMKFVGEVKTLIASYDKLGNEK